MTMATRSLLIHCLETDAREVLRVEPPLLARNACLVHFATLNELRPRYEVLCDLLDEEERMRALRFRFHADRERFELGHGWMRELLAHYTGVPAKDITFVRGRFGKPTLTKKDLCFNLSDTKDAVALAVCSTMELGLDLETLDRSVDHEAVSAHYFTPEERTTIGKSEQPKSTFLELWTRKEAVLKASGVGIMDDLRSLRVNEPLNKLTIQHTEFMAMAAPEYHVRTWRTSSGHLISLATPRPLEQAMLFGA
ncbi:MAG TPA: 4'-phosphopantetheinyl transferase superfamily protein [Flavobacteriales bacterium]|nr:4'-phosphopantetheinyl transferase superfamily protein [Flavobacteriales bacterium]HNU57727.1 4'-phosphopantetheinyl transferase superfamily protein [Flavobacteriales bacterium]